DAESLGAIFARPRFGQQIDGGLARSIEAQALHPEIGGHRRDVDDCSFASLRHQRSKLSDEKIGRLHVDRVDVVKRLLARFVRRAERIDARVIDQDVDMAASQLDGPSRERTGARGVAKIGRDEIGFPARYPYFGNRLFTAFRVAAYDHDMNT